MSTQQNDTAREYSVTTAVWTQTWTVRGPHDVKLRRAYRRPIAAAPLPSRRAPATVAPDELQWTPTVATYHLGSTVQLATAMLRGLSPTECRCVGLQLGRDLAAQHSLPAEPLLRSLPPGLDRLQRHLATATRDRVPFMTREQAHIVRSHVKDVLERIGHGVAMSFGGLSLGDVYVTAEGYFQLVSGPESCLAAPELDLGWLVGEATELALAGYADPLHAPLDLEAIRQEPFIWSLLQGHRERTRDHDHGLDTGLVVRVAALRLVLHAHDYWASFHDSAESLHHLIVQAEHLLTATPEA